ncbi:MAG: hypothetical protein ACI4SY_05955, partial [Sutterella sp.]
KLPGDLPEKTGHYLVTIHIEDFPPKVQILGFLKRGGFDWYSDCDDELKAWAELPEPYPEDEDESAQQS